MRRCLPNHLYLGSRIHHAPAVVARQAAKFTDVFTVNHYWSRAATGSLPRGIDMPVLIGEFQFAALDRGPPGASLYGVHDQTQRSRAYAGYVLSALAHPNIVGTHWFTYGDQSSAGRPGENYQIGFVDITDTPYPEIVDICRRLSGRLYTFRQSGNGDVNGMLESIIKAP
jgi:hypothetical protein